MLKTSTVLSLALALLLFQIEYATAQSKITKPLDRSFVVQLYGVADTETNPDKAGSVVFHKVIKQNGRVYVCGGYKGFSGVYKKFLDRAKIEASEGTRIIRGLGSFTNLQIKLSSKDFRGASTRAEKAQLNKLLNRHRLVENLYGTPVTCRRSLKKWQNNFSDGKTMVVLPEKITITRN
ncbi:MAG: hypothetical protein ACI84R_002837 [Candidatus Azotimanducaceae bacterium]|jgi:hypothetical protein